MLSCSTSNNDIIGQWSIKEAMGKGTNHPENLNTAFINFGKDGKVNGNATVNVFNGEYTINGEKLELRNIGMTRMMGANMDAEDAITKAINTTASIKIKGNTATVYDAQNNVVMKLDR